MADGLENGTQIVRAVDDHAAEAPLHRPLGFARRRTARRESSPHSRKFVIATGALIAVAVVAVVVSLSVLLSGHGRASHSSWSQWSPPDSGLAGEREIANELAPLYRATAASQLALVTVHNVSDNGTSTALALRDPSNGSLSAISGTTAIFTLCGLGPNCTIAAGAPSAARLLLLRREALELSLYTFKYISGIDNVVSILPPGRTQATARLTRRPPSPGRTATTSTVDLSVVFQRSGLQHYLSQPLASTLPEQIPPTVALMPYAREAELVSVITGEALFTQQMIQAQDGTNVLVLSPAPAQ